MQITLRFCKFCGARRETSFCMDCGVECEKHLFVSSDEVSEMLTTVRTAAQNSVLAQIRRMSDPHEVAVLELIPQMKEHGVGGTE